MRPARRSGFNFDRQYGAGTEAAIAKEVAKRKAARKAKAAPKAKAKPKAAPKSKAKKFHVQAGTAAAHERAVKAALTRKRNKTAADLQARGYKGVTTRPLAMRPGQPGEPPLVGNPDYLEEMRHTTYRGGYYDPRTGIRKTYP